jgi:hypothetical protein
MYLSAGRCSFSILRDYCRINSSPTNHLPFGEQRMDGRKEVPHMFKGIRVTKTHNLEPAFTGKRFFLLKGKFNLLGLRCPSGHFNKTCTWTKSLQLFILDIVILSPPV